MRRIKIVLLLAPSLLLVPLTSVPAANANTDPNTIDDIFATVDSRTPTSDQGVKVPDSDTNQALDFLAKKLAVAVSSIEVRQTLHDAIGKRFDGDTNALWSSVAEGSTFNAKVAAASRGQAKSATAEQIANTAGPFPRLQIAVPERFGSWDPTDYAPLVAFFPEGVEDTELDTITAYDADGNPVLLDAKVPPKNPVIVLGMNERTDESGKLRNEESVARSAGPVETSAVSAAGARVKVRMYLVDLKSDKEPWAKGAAEINMESKGDGCGFVYDDYNWAGLNHSGDAWQGPRVLGYTTCSVVFYWWEDDGGDWDFTLTWGGVNLGAHMDDGDDKIGGGRIPRWKFAGGGVHTWDRLEWSALYQYTD